MQTNKDAFIFIFKIMFILFCLLNFTKLNSPLVPNFNLANSYSSVKTQYTDSFLHPSHVHTNATSFSSLCCKKGILQYYGHLFMTLCPSLDSVLAPSTVPDI